MDANELARCKWHNFVGRFMPELEAAEFTSEQLATDWNTIAGYITLAWLYRAAVDTKDEQLLRTSLEASDAPNKEALLQVWDKMTDERKALFWRYLQWFFNCVLC